MSEQKIPGDTIRPKILIVDDEVEFIQRATRLLGGDYELEAVDSWEAAKKFLESNPISVILLDYDLKDGWDGLDVIEKLREAGPLSLAIILISKFMQRDLELSGYEKGADYCMSKAADDEAMKREISNAITHNLEKRKLLIQEKEELEKLVIPTFKSGAMNELLGQIAGFINTDENILITGERGAGKGVLARWIHHKSGRGDRILTEINLPGLQESLFAPEMFGFEKGIHDHADDMKLGLLEIADGGSMVLDEIGDLRPDLQAKLLKVLEEDTFMRVGGTRPIPFDVRFMALTNRPDLRKQVEKGLFRGDFYDRLKTCHLHVPPLRERREDIPEIAGSILERSKKDYKRPDIEGFDDGLMNAMLEYDWPGNVRDLDIWIKSGVINANGVTIKIGDVEKSVRISRGKVSQLPFIEDWYSMTLDNATDCAQKELIEYVLVATNGSMAKAAERLAEHRVNMYRHCDRLGIDYKKFRKKKK
ncbi:MAG: sigma-54-dependent Fis family transcriptional regulator [Candidatus Krumholzibacteria bacterium]|nr:sigma-54-dependent Fis family transcriptional regulator [Candidatus Krumholzibacteria bacterium]